MRLRLPILTLFVAMLSWGVAQAAAITGRVVHMADGDTITILDSHNEQHRVRLAGIDAPEKGQPFGQRSKQNLSAMIAGRTVTVEFLKFDRYQRMVGKVMLDGRDICLEQIKAGMAWHYKKYDREQSAEDRALYAAAEDLARAARRGLWQDKDQVPPWDWRKRR
jgi:endonuclease YncB( thermonuclease family)